ncbi:MAG: hypothetical protein D8M54_22340 [Chloroflexi bacterium]|nr:hypothetical protein [Chloroflexota bacterium]
MPLRRRFALRLQRAKSAFADWNPAHAVPALNLVKGGLRLLLACTEPTKVCRFIGHIEKYAIALPCPVQLHQNQYNGQAVYTGKAGGADQLLPV